eukprot:362355-Chlamydomonas_euryale.AAC.8
MRVMCGAWHVCSAWLLSLVRGRAGVLQPMHVLRKLCASAAHIFWGKGQSRPRAVYGGSGSRLCCSCLRLSSGWQLQAVLLRCREPCVRLGARPGAQRCALLCFCNRLASAPGSAAMCPPLFLQSPRKQE